MCYTLKMKEKMKLMHHLTEGDTALYARALHLLDDYYKEVTDGTDTQVPR